MASDSLIEDYNEWLKEVGNEKRTYGDFLDEYYGYDEVEFYEKWISETEVDYLDAKRKGYKNVMDAMKELIPVLKEKRKEAIKNKKREEFS
jgi:hypothetical protein